MKAMEYIKENWPVVITFVLTLVLFIELVYLISLY